jgi:glutamyl-tRNA reductase
VLAQLFHRARHLGQQVKAKTAIDQQVTSLLRVAGHLLSQRHPLLTQGKVLIVGTSKLAHWAAQALRATGPQPLALINRTAAQTEAMLRYAPEQTFPWQQMRTALAWADVVITATAVLHPVLDADDLAAALAQRWGPPLLLIDLHLPRNIHPAVASMDQVIAYDLPDVCLALTDLARAEMTRGDASGSWVADLPVVKRMVQEEATALRAWIEHAACRVIAPPVKLALTLVRFAKIHVFF